jgi:Protein of unknown function (DUF3551)
MRVLIGRSLIGLGALAAIMAADITVASAQNRPWCLRSGFSGPGWCGFDTFAQCQASASGQGGSCIENNMLAWQRQKAQQKQRRQNQNDWRWQ